LWFSLHIYLLKKGILYLNNKVIQIIRLIIKQDLIHYDNRNLLLDINNPEIDNIYNNLCGKLLMTTTITGGKKKYIRRKKKLFVKNLKNRKKNIHIKIKNNF
jgi:hypothetical protein